MLKRSFLLCGLAVLVVAVSSCILDPAPGDPPVDPPKNIVVQDLTQKWHVLNNIEYAYNKFNSTVYNDLLDDEFTFFFASGDVGGGLPVQWGRADEFDAADCLFTSKDGGPAGPNCKSDRPVCRSIRMDLIYDNVQWVEVIPEQYPDETWYTTTIPYSFTFEMEPDQTFTSEPNAKAQFTVRNVGTDTAPHWQLVEYRDLAGN